MFIVTFVSGIMIDTWHTFNIIIMKRNYTNKIQLQDKTHGKPGMSQKMSHCLMVFNAKNNIAHPNV